MHCSCTLPFSVLLSSYALHSIALVTCSSALALFTCTLSHHVVPHLLCALQSFCTLPFSRALQRVALFTCTLSHHVVPHLLCGLQSFCTLPLSRALQRVALFACTHSHHVVPHLLCALQLFCTARRAMPESHVVCLLSLVGRSAH